ncbi:MAG TPA: hypothetical protein VFN91_19680, partial [Myxococcaceae bacterium]|nr:hypothetical protein [Myxococcaceae bacterium]
FNPGWSPNPRLAATTLEFCASDFASELRRGFRRADMVDATCSCRPRSTWLYEVRRTWGLWPKVPGDFVHRLACREHHRSGGVPEAMEVEPVGPLPAELSPTEGLAHIAPLQWSAGSAVRGEPAVRFRALLLEGLNCLEQ